MDLQSYDKDKGSCLTSQNTPSDSLYAQLSVTEHLLTPPLSSSTTIHSLVYSGMHLTDRDIISMHKNNLLLVCGYCY